MAWLFLLDAGLWGGVGAEIALGIGLNPSHALKIPQIHGRISRACYPRFGQVGRHGTM